MPPSFSRFGREILFYRESTEGTLVVGQDRGTRSEAKYSYVNNAAVIGSSYDAVKAVKMIGHFPFFLGHDCRDVLVIGFGIGVTTSAIAAHPWRARPSSASSWWTACATPRRTTATSTATSWPIRG